MARKKPINPFYVVLVIVGAAFAITASAYGVTAMRALRTDSASATAPSESSLTPFMANHGNNLLLGELVILAIATVAAISTDDYWTRRAKLSNESSSENKP